MTRGLERNIGGRLLPRPVMWFSVAMVTLLAIFLAAGTVDVWRDASSSTPWRVMTPLAALACGGTAAMVYVAVLRRPRAGLDALTHRNNSTEGLLLKGSRAVPVTALFVTAVWSAAAAAGAFFADGGARVALLVLLALLALAFGGAATAARRPRYVLFTRGSVESSTQRSLSRIAWDDIATVSVPITGGGDFVLRLHPYAVGRVITTWHNPFERRADAVDVDLAALGVDPDRLAGVVRDLVAGPSLRGLLESDPNAILRRLV